MEPPIKDTLKGDKPLQQVSFTLYKNDLQKTVTSSEVPLYGCYYLHLVVKVSKVTVHGLIGTLCVDGQESQLSDWLQFPPEQIDNCF